MTFKDFIQNIFSVKNIDYHKSIKICGIKIKFETTKLLLKKQNKMLEEKLWRIDQKVDESSYYILANKLHANLEKYKGCHQEQDIVILGCGSSLQYFEPIKNAVYMGINRSYKYNKVKLDYLFASDQFPEGMEDFINYDKDGRFCKKFLSYLFPEYPHRMTLKNSIDINHEKLVWNPRMESRIPQDLSYQPFGSYWIGTTTFLALQLALYMLPKRIYIVGCDCTKGNIYRKEPTPVNPSDSYEYQLYGWGLIKEDIQNFYPEIEVISVNPIGLRGYFKDVYTQSFIDAYPELKNENIEIINEEGLCKNQ